MEVWRDVENYEGLYAISNLGRVKSFRGWNGKRYIEREFILKASVQYVEKGSPYERHTVRLTKEAKSKEFKIHRLVAMTFINNPENKPSVNHIDGNPLNNDVSNLEWCTQKENVAHALETGLKRVVAKENKEKIVELYKKNTPIKQICRMIDSGFTSTKNVLIEEGLEIKNNHFYRNKYNIDRKVLSEDIEKGMSNKEMANKHKTNTSLIATYKSKHKKGELLI